MIDYTEDWVFLLILHRKGSVAYRACYFAIPVAILAIFFSYLDELNADFRERFGLMDLNKSQLWSASTVTLGVLLTFRTNRAMARFWEGTGLLHQMRGEWFDSISCCVTFSHMALAAKPSEVRSFRHTLVRLMSLCHGSALEEIAGNNAEEVDTIDPYGLDTSTLEHLNACKHEYNFNRVEVLLHMTQTIITRALEEGVLKIPPPILSRVYQTLSRGFVNLLNAKKIADTRFPFPYAQLIALLFCFHMILTPLLMSCIIPNKWWAAVFSFVPMFAMSSVNMIGIELENPFGSDDNDLPLHHFQGEMNKCLMMLLHPSADTVPGVDDSRCIYDFQELAKQFHGEYGDEDKFNETTMWEHRPGKSQRLSKFSKTGSRLDIIDQLNEDLKRQSTKLEEADEYATNQDARSSFSRRASEDATAASSVSTKTFASTSSNKKERSSLAGAIGMMRQVVVDATNINGFGRGSRILGVEQKSVGPRDSATTAAGSPEDSRTELSDLRNQNIQEHRTELADAAYAPDEKDGCIEAKSLVDARKELLETVTGYNSALPELRNLVERQVKELGESITALKDFSNSLPLVIDSMISDRGNLSALRRDPNMDKRPLAERPSPELRAPLTPNAGQKTRPCSPAMCNQCTS